MKIKINFIYHLFTIIFFITSITASANAESVKKDQSLAIHTENILVDSHYIIYNWVGQGNNILLLHGMFGSKEQWQELMRFLAARGYHVIAPDLPGYGKSLGYAESDYSPDKQVLLIRKFVEKLHLDKINVAGNSLGGLIAALYARNYPDSVSSLALIGGAFGVKSPNASAADKLLAEGVNPFVPLTEQEFNQEMQLLFTNPPKFDDDKIEKRLARYNADKDKDLKIWTMAQAYNSIFNKSFLVTAPTLILWGDKDHAIDISGAEIIKHNINGSTLVVVKNGSHLLFMENPKTIADYYLNFLEKNIK